jgi:uncharacterized glyoxalase superfamily protein PhnB
MTFVPDGIGIVVSDMKASLAFYRLLGFPIPEQSDKDEPDDHVECVFNGYRFMWDTIDVMRSFEPNWQMPAGESGQRVSFALGAQTPAEVDALVETLWTAGYKIHKAPWDAFWGQRYAQVCDPDGTTIDLFAPLPTS